MLELTAAMLIASVAFAGLGVVFVHGLDVYARSMAELRMQQQGTYAMNELAAGIRAADDAQVSTDGTLVLTTAASPADQNPVKRTVTFRCQGGKLTRTEMSGRESRTTAVVPYDDRQDTLEVKTFAVRIVDSIPGQTVVAESLLLESGGNELAFVSRTLMRNRFWRMPGSTGK